MELGLVRRLLLPSEIFVSARYGSAALTLIYTTTVTPLMSRWSPSRVITDRKSRFQGFHIPLTTSKEIPSLIEQFLAENKAAKRASHPHIYAWKTQTGQAIAQGHEDNGEKGAGARLLDGVVLKHDLTNILVIVTRWYGGTPLGGARFRHIVHAGVDLIKKRMN